MERVLLILKTESKPVGGFIWGCSIYRADTQEKISLKGIIHIIRLR